MEFREFQVLNRARCQYIDSHSSEGELTPVELGLALASEVGQLCYLLKKFTLASRNDYALPDVRQKILDEVADIITYADSVCTSLHADTGQVILDKFNRVCRRWSYPAIAAQPHDGRQSMLDLVGQGEEHT